jgi:hypothetical protein
MSVDNQGLFISTGLRPPVGEVPPDDMPLAPGAAKDEMRRRAEETIGEWQRERLGLDEGKPSAEIWQKTFAQCAHVNSTVLEKEAVLLNLANGIYYTLNPLGTAIWEMLTGDRSLEVISAALCERFDVSEDRVRTDLAALVARLRCEQLIEERR